MTPTRRPRKSYPYLVNRARSGEPVAIDTTRPDIGYVIDYLVTIDGRGLTIQCDTEFNILWLVKNQESSSCQA